MKNNPLFWNIGQTLTHNVLINVIVGNRGGGKSFGAKQRAIDNFINKGEQFGYIRRYKDDLIVPMQQFFQDILHEYPDYEFKVENKKFYIRLKSSDEKLKWTEDDVAGYGFILSTASNKKSISYPNVTMLIFDEFLLDKGNIQYIPNEPLALLNLYETIARPGTPGRKRCVLFMLANAISITNPYFLFWDLKMPTKQDKNGKWIWKHPTRPILVEDVRNDEFIKVKSQSEFGRLVAGTKYADYSINNKFLLDSDTFLERKGYKARYYFTMIYKDKPLGVWADFNEGRMWVSEDTDPSCIVKYSLTIKDHQPNTMFLKTAGRRGMFKVFIDNYKLGNVRFENMNIKNLCYEILQLYTN